MARRSQLSPVSAPEPGRARRPGAGSRRWVRRADSRSTRRAARGRRTALAAILTFGMLGALLGVPSLGQAAEEARAVPLAENPPQGGDGEARMAMRRDLVARLTGHPPYRPADGSAVARSTPRERVAAADLLYAALVELGLEGHRQPYRRANLNGWVDLIVAPYQGENVYATVPATARTGDASPCHVVVGAHYDTEPGTPGAGDNAAGVALVHSLASRIAALEERSLAYVFVFFDQEEDDEVGSRAFVDLLRDGWRVHSVHVTDVVAWDEDGDRGVELQSPGALEARYRESADRMGIPLTVTEGASSDNKSFLAAGYTTAGVWSDELTPHIHRESDTFETVDFEMLATIENLMFDVLVGLDPTDGGCDG